MIVDSQSKYPVVELTSSTAFHKIKPILEKVFTAFGLPSEVKMDNGPPFQVLDFTEYLNAFVIQHQKITMQWPQANGEAELFMCMLNKALWVGMDQGDDLEWCLHQLLMV